MKSEVRDFFRTIAMKANRSSSAKQMMKEWVGHYDGKVVQFQTGIELFYIIVTNESIKVCEGEYPSSDIILRGSSKLITDVFTQKKSMESAMKRWELVVLGAGHDGFALRKIIASIVSRGA
jgi:hypothetical protein